MWIRKGLAPASNGLAAALLNAEHEINRLELENEGLRGQIDGMMHLLNQRDTELRGANSACGNLMEKLNAEQKKNAALRGDLAQMKSTPLPKPAPFGNKIPYESRKTVYNAAIEHWGADAQALKAIEELAEVIVEIAKWWNNIGDLEHMAEETADATIMLEQLRLMYDLNEKVCAYMDEKVERLEKRIAGEK